MMRKLFLKFVDIIRGIKILAPTLGTIIGVIIGWVSWQCLLFLGYPIGYNYSPSYYGVAILVICIALTIGISYGFFQRVMPISLTTITFSFVYKAGILLRVKNPTINTPEVISFVIVIGMFVVGNVFTFMHRRSYNETVDRRIEELCDKQNLPSNFERTIKKFVKEVKQPSLWMVFDDKPITLIKNILKIYAVSAVDQQQYNDDVDSITFEMNFLQRMWFTGVLAFAASVSLYCTALQAIPKIIP